MNSNLKFGDLLHRNTGIAVHPGVYLWNGSVIHNLPTQGVVITSFNQFADGKDVKVISTKEEDVHLMAARLNEIMSGDVRYNLLLNNCEHIAYYIVKGRKMSPQVQAAIAGILIGAVTFTGSSNSRLLGASLGGVTAILILKLCQDYDYRIHQH